MATSVIVMPTRTHPDTFEPIVDATNDSMNYNP